MIRLKSRNNLSALRAALRYKRDFTVDISHRGKWLQNGSLCILEPAQVGMLAGGMVTLRSCSGGSNVRRRDRTSGKTNTVPVRQLCL